MKKLFPLLIVLLMLINLGVASIAGFAFSASSGEEEATDEHNHSRSARYDQTSPSIYDPSNVYYLVCPTVRSTIQFLKGVPYISDGSDPDLNKRPMINGAIYAYPWPAGSMKPAKLIYNQSFTGNPFISLVINSLTTRDKTFIVTLGIDTNDQYDPHSPTSLEHRCEFPPYQTTGEVTQDDPTMEEELYEAYGTWQGGTPPSVIQKGRVILEVSQTGPIGEEAITYCGFNFKSSWIASPYMHTDLIPRAKINSTYLDQGFPPAEPIAVGERVFFDGVDSYDPNDDLNGNEKIDGFEIDRLRYQWSWGDGTSTNFANDNRRASHVYSSASIPLTAEYKEFYVNLTVMDDQGHTDQDSTKVRIYRGNQSPEILSLKINGIEQLTTNPQQVRSILDRSITVWFTTIATDKDGDDITYYWDFDADGEFDIIGNTAVASTVPYVFSEPGFNVGKHEIKLKVSDGTLAPDKSASCFIYLERNIYPMAVVKARREFDSRFYSESILVKLNQLITFYSNESYDPDNNPGFDIDNDNQTDFQLKFRWTFNKYDPSATSGWITETEYSYSYISPGNYQYEVTLDVDDGVNISTSMPFLVKINVRPLAKIVIDSESYNIRGNFEMHRPIYFNGSSSYDPNGDDILNYTWMIGTGDNAVIRYGEIMAYTFTEPGEHTASLAVYDGEFWSTQYSVKVDLPELPDPPTPRYTVYPLMVNTSELVNFDASETTDPDSDQKDLTFKWYFGDGGYKSLEVNKTTHRYTSPGTYKVTLEVEDETGRSANISKVIVTVKNRPPHAKIKQLNPVDVGESVQVSAADSSDDDGEIVRYIWYFGDGSDEITGNTSHIQVNHSWKKPGTYTIELTVQDDQGGTSETSIQIKVKEEDGGKGGFGGLTQEETNTLIAGAIITIIVVVVIIIVVVVLIRTRENI